MKQVYILQKAIIFTEYSQILGVFNEYPSIEMLSDYLKYEGYLTKDDIKNLHQNKFVRIDRSNMVEGFDFSIASYFPE